MWGLSKLSNNDDDDDDGETMMAAKNISVQKAGTFNAFKEKSRQAVPKIW